MCDLKIYVITLKSALERQGDVTKQLERYDFEWSFVDAVDGSLFSGEIKEYPEKKVKRLLGFDMTPSEIGCYLSHKKIWRLIADDSRIGLVFEDDFLLQNDFLKAIEFALKNKDKWEILRLQGLSDLPSDIVTSEGGFDLVINDGDPLGATAYMLKPDSAEVLFQASSVIYEPLDHFLEHESKHGLIVSALLPYPVKASGVETTIPDRPYSERSVKGLKKIQRSFFRFLDRNFSSDPWFNK